MNIILNDNKSPIDEYNKEFNSDCYSLVYKYFIEDEKSAVQDGLPIDKLLLLNPVEKQEIIKLLKDRLKKQDWRAVVGLGELKEAKAKEMLFKLLNSFKAKIDGSFRVDLAVPLVVIRTGFQACL